MAETFDGQLNDLKHLVVTPSLLVDGITNSSQEPISEAHGGGGTGRMCQGWKGGTGTSSRVILGSHETSYSVAALVQANYCRLQRLHIAGVPVGRILQKGVASSKTAATNEKEYDETKDKKYGSIITIIAADAFLLPGQLQRFAKRAIVGFARLEARLTTLRVTCS